MKVIGAMECGDLTGRFRLGDWVVDPAGLQLTTGRVCRTLDPRLMRVLVCLAQRHGEVVDRQTLRECVGDDENASDDMLRAGVHELRELLGDSAREPRYIVAVPHRGYALIAHFEPLEPGSAGRLSGAGPQDPAIEPLLARMQHLAVELQRRHVLKVVGAYMVGIWIVLQVAETTFEPLHFPDWWLTALTILGIIGVPVITILAWSYEITPGGIILDPMDAGHLKLPHARRAIAPLLVIGVSLMAGVTGLAWWRSIATREPASTLPAIPTPLAVAVMPFADLTTSGPGRHVGDGLAEDISADLDQAPGLHVVSPASTFKFKGGSHDARQIGEALGTHYVLQGSVFRDGGRLRVTAQLVKAASGRRVWSESYDREWQYVTAIPAEISLAVAGVLGVAPGGASNRSRKDSSRGNLLAYDHYLAGVSALRSSGDLSQMQAAMELFHKALEIDPDFARALAGLCAAGVAHYERTLNTADVAEAENHCRRALELDPTLRETELALARLYLTSGRYEQAEAVFRGLIARNAGDADAHAGLGRALIGEGRAEDAERSFRRAVAVDPHYPGGYRSLGEFLFQTGRPAEAESAYRKVIEFSPRSASAFSNLGAAQMMQGEFREAARTFNKSLDIEPSRSGHANLGTAYYYLGLFEDALFEYEQAEAMASADPLVVGNLADALWMIPGRHAEAATVYGRAATLAEEALQVNPTDAVMWAQLAYFTGRAGDATRSHRAQVRADALGKDDMYVQYYTALTESDRDDPAAAAAAIQRALQLGYPQKLLATDPVLRAWMPESVASSAAERK